MRNRFFAYPITVEINEAADWRKLPNRICSHYRQSFAA
jgi:hypothetical protein